MFPLGFKGGGRLTGLNVFALENGTKIASFHRKENQRLVNGKEAKKNSSGGR